MMDEPSKDILGCGSISEDKANWLLEQAGDLIPKDPEQITLRQYKILLLDNVIQEVLQENRVGFKLQDFQLVTLHCLGSLKNVVLVVPTGAGKMLCSSVGWSSDGYSA